MNGHYTLHVEYQQRGILHIFELACDDEHHLEDSDLPRDVQQSYYNNSGSPQDAFSICLLYHATGNMYSWSQLYNYIEHLHAVHMHSNRKTQYNTYIHTYH